MHLCIMHAICVTTDDWLQQVFLGIPTWTPINQIPITQFCAILLNVQISMDTDLTCMPKRGNPDIL